MTDVKTKAARSIVGLVIAALLFSPVAAFAQLPNDPALNQIGGVEILQLSEAWNITQGSPNVIVAVIDAGVDITNPDLSENIWVNPRESLDGFDNDGNTLVDDVHGWNFVQNNGDVRPVTATSSSRVGLNHGSVIAGIIGAVGNNGIGGAGVNWRVKIMPLKILDERGDGDTDLAVKAIDYAIQKKAHIINLSFVGPTPSLDFIQAVRRAYRAGILIVAAAGNAPEGSVGSNLNNFPQYPVCFDDPLKEENWVIGVAALNESGLLAQFSNYGSRCTDLSAPGFRLPSTILVDTTVASPQIYGGAWSGTSVAAPFVSGVAALIKSVQPTWTPDQIRKAILETVDPIPGNTTHAAGLGSVNAYKAVRYAQQGGDGGLPSGFYIAPVKTNKGTSADIFDTSFKKIKSIDLGKGSVSDTGLITADIDASGITQIVAAVADSKGSLIRIMQRDGKLINQLRPFGNKERGNMSIAAVDLDANGSDELIVSSDSLRRVVILEKNGSTRATISIPEKTGKITVAAYRQTDRSIIVSAIQQGKLVKVYVWDNIGSFITSYTLKTENANRVRIGFTSNNEGTGKLYMTQQVGNSIVVNHYTPEGQAINSFTARPSTGQIFGYVFGRTTVSGDDMSFVLSTSQSKSTAFEVVDSQGEVTTSIKNDGKPLKYLNLYFGK